MKSSSEGGGGHPSQEEHHLKAKEAEVHIRELVDQIVASNTDETSMGALELLHKLVTK